MADIAVRIVGSQTVRTDRTGLILVVTARQLVDSGEAAVSFLHDLRALIKQPLRSLPPRILARSNSAPCAVPKFDAGLVTWDFVDQVRLPGGTR
jgi:hypothetical protein